MYKNCTTERKTKKYSQSQEASATSPFTTNVAQTRRPTKRTLRAGIIPIFQVFNLLDVRGSLLRRAFKLAAVRRAVQHLTSSRSPNCRDRHKLG